MKAKAYTLAISAVSIASFWLVVAAPLRSI